MMRLHVEIALLLVLVGLASHPATAQPQPDESPCQAPTATLEERIAGCSAIIESGREQGRALAIAYCNRGYALTEKRELDRAIADLDAAIKIDPKYACPYSNRGRALRA